MRSTPGCVREDSVPRLSAPKSSALPAPSGSVANIPSGRLVVLDRSDAGVVGKTVSQLDARGISTVELPGILVPQPVLQMSTSGERLSGLTTEDGHAINIWSYDENTKSVTLAQTALPQGTPTAWASWSPDARHAAYVPDSQNKQSRLFLVDLAGQTEELSLHNAYVYEVAWRSNHELSLMINESGPLYPLSGATLVVWDLDRPGITQVVMNVRAATSSHVWSPDGSAVVYQDEDVAGGPDRLVRRTGAGINVAIWFVRRRSLPLIGAGARMQPASQSLARCHRASAAGISPSVLRAAVPLSSSERPRIATSTARAPGSTAIASW